MKHQISIAFGSKKTNIFFKLKSKFGEAKALKILQHTGPKIIYSTKDNEDSVSLSVKACRKINIDKKVKNIIFVSQNTKHKFPGNSSVLLSQIKNNSINKSFDINAGCTGFIDALEIANNLMGDTLIITSETYNKNIKLFNRSISTIFADAAAAFIFKKKDYKNLKFVSGINAKDYKNLMCDHNKDMFMNGAEVFQYVKNEVYPEFIKFLIENKKNVKAIFIHQGSKLVTDFFREKIKKYKINIPTNILSRGNTVSATIPILMYDYEKKNRIIGKDKIILCGFGVGLSYKICLMEMK